MRGRVVRPSSAPSTTGTDPASLERTAQVPVRLEARHHSNEGPSRNAFVDACELRARARQEADELGPEPPGTEAELWREERWGAVVLLAGLADDNVELLRQAANEVAAEWTDREAARCCWMRRPSPRSARRSA
jgi:hypothetical protein